MFMKILIIEDEYNLADAISCMLQAKKYNVVIKTDGEKGLEEALTDIYDLIILDCAPIIGLSDSLILATLSDIKLITVSCKKTKIESLERTKKLFDQSGIKISGVIVNKVPTSTKGYYSYYYTNDYYGYGSKE